MAEDRAPENNNDAAQGGDEVDMSRRHPLEYRWTLWFDNPTQKQSLNKFGQGLRPVYSFDTVEDFWW
jgi:translation initiation factor 4E